MSLGRKNGHETSLLDNISLFPVRTTTSIIGTATKLFLDSRLCLHIHSFFIYQLAAFIHAHFSYYYPFFSIPSLYTTYLSPPVSVITLLLAKRRTPCSRCQHLVRNRVVEGDERYHWPAPKSRCRSNAWDDANCLLCGVAQKMHALQSRPLITTLQPLEERQPNITQVSQWVIPRATTKTIVASLQLFHRQQIQYYKTQISPGVQRK